MIYLLSGFEGGTAMTERILDINAFPAYFLKKFTTPQVRVREDNRIVTIEPIEQTAAKPKHSERLRGMFEDYPEMSVDKFLERKRADKELDL
jgi:hypothetical protein